MLVLLVLLVLLALVESQEKEVLLVFQEARVKRYGGQLACYRMHRFEMPKCH